MNKKALRLSALCERKKKNSFLAKVAKAQRIEEGNQQKWVKKIKSSLRLSALRERKKKNSILAKTAKAQRIEEGNQQNWVKKIK